MRHRIHREIWLVLAITFGMSGLRSLLRLIDATLSPVALNEQSTTLNSSQADSPWLDLALQLCGAGTLIAWGLLSLFLLAVNTSEHRIPGPLLRLTSAKTWLTEIGWGALLALAIGVPGLAFYVTAVHLGLSKQVIPSSLETWWTIPILLLYSFANAFAEEIVVVGWLSTRLRQLGKSTGFILLACSLLRGSYHLYQGFSAGIGNMIMGLLFTWFYLKWRPQHIWPLIVGHFLIDAVAFVGYSLIGGNLQFLGL